MLAIFFGFITAILLASTITGYVSSGIAGIPGTKKLLLVGGGFSTVSTVIFGILTFLAHSRESSEVFNPAIITMVIIAAISAVVAFFINVAALVQLDGTDPTTNQKYSELYPGAHRSIVINMMILAVVTMFMIGTIFGGIHVARNEIKQAIQTVASQQMVPSYTDEDGAYKQLQQIRAN